MPKENGQTILRADLRLRALIGVAAKTSTTIEPALLLALATLLTATICYAGAAIFGRGFKELDPIMPAAGSLTCAAAILVPIALVVDRPWTLTPSLASIVALLSLSVFSTALAFIIYFRLVHTLGSIGTTAQAYLRVPIGVAIAVLFLGESLTSTAWAGLACVVAGVAAMTIPNRKCPISQPTEPQLRQ
ncbi:MAG: DMT family transporter [Vulcanimicrobiaceae bacterium]